MRIVRRNRTLREPRAPRGAGLCRMAMLLVAALASLAFATPPADAREPISIAVHQGTVIRLPRPAAAVFVADPETADVQTHSASLVYVFGKRSGRTTLIAVDRNDGVILQREIEVGHDLEGLRGLVREIAPGGRVVPRSIAGSIILAGQVGEPRQAQLIREAAARYLGQEETLVDQLEVTSPTQVNLRVRVAEVSRQVSKLIGINWDALFNSGSFVFGLATGRDFLPTGSSEILRLSDTSGTAAGVLGGVSTSNLNVNALLDLLERQGLLTVLAEPNLTALSGETASFLAGGEFPIPVNESDGNIQIQFKQFGVSLAFTPTVLGRDRISLRVRPEVSELTDQGAVRINDLVVPALSTRRADTTIELASGQSFAIGGLLSRSTRDNIESVPGLADLPVLGPLFRSSNYRRQETELVIIVTPYFVKPVVEAALATPLDDLRLTNDLDRMASGEITRSAMMTSAASVPLRGPGTFRLR